MFPVSTEKIKTKLNLKVLNEAGERTAISGYTGDLLSWVMGRVEADAAWVTVMTNVNVIAVASLRDVACVIVSEGANVPDEVITRAKENMINLYATDMNSFDAVKAICEID
ncbi:MAG: hypothetical protein J5940_06660 [Clostridia bacterium]|nr:hypothetical protein [Clostridia bacterium]